MLSCLVCACSGQLPRNNYVSHYDTPIYNCNISIVVQGEWYGRVVNLDTTYNIDASTMTDRRICIESKKNFADQYQYLFHENPSDPNSCYHCQHIFVRTVNILEMTESGCVQGFDITEKENTTKMLEEVCAMVPSDQQFITLFNEDYTPINCRSSIEGVYQFAYQYRFTFTAECDHPEQQVHSCQNVGSQFLISNQKFNVTYKKCQGMDWTSDSIIEYSCLGDWFVGKDHFFAVVNTK